LRYKEKSMNLKPSQLASAAERGLISPQQAEQLWDFLSAQTDDSPGFRLTHILYYLGGMIAIGAMSLFMNLGWERFGGAGLLTIALLYAATALWLTEHLLNRMHLPIPAGIAAAFVVVLTPLAVYGAQLEFNWWPEGMAYRDYHVYIDWRWIMMEFATLITGAVMLWRYVLPFLVMPVAVTLWYMSMDITPFLFHDQDYSWGHRKVVSLCFGLFMVLIAFIVDIRTRHGKDYPFWLYLFGVLAFWGGLSTLEGNSELNKFLYLCINLLMIFTGAVLSRRIFAVFGGIGATGYLYHLADMVFKDSLLFPFALTFIGLGIVYLGIIWQRHEKATSTRLRQLLLVPLRELIEKRQ